MSVSKEDMQNLNAMINSSKDGHLPEEQSAEEIAAAAQAAAGGEDETPEEETARLEAEAAAIAGVGEEETPEEEAARLAEEAAAAEAGGDDAEGLYTPAQLAEAIEWPVEDLYGSLVIPMDDGQPPVPLGEFKNNFQNLARDHKALQDKFDEQGGMLQQASAGFGQNQQMSAEMIQAQGYLGSIQRMEEATDWAELEELDPSQAVLKRQKFQQARQDVEGQIQQLQQQQQVAQQQYLQQAAVKMVELIPSWGDAKAKQADQDVIRAHMQTAGFVDQEINQIADPRIMALLKELVDLRGQASAATAAVRKVRQAPKVLAGRGRGKKPDKKTVTKGFVTKAQQTGKKGDQLNAVKSILKDGFQKQS